VGESPLFYCSSDMPAIEKTALVERITKLGERAATGTEIELADVQVRGAGKNRLVRVYIDKPAGVTHGDCELISERLGRLLDEEDVMPDEGYTLQVSSLGLERPLSKPRDFERVVGHKIRVTLRQPLNGVSHFEGKLAGFAENVLSLQDPSGQPVEIPLDLVRKANLKFEW
jgi:ribosome maturation factor RimP